MNNILGLKIGDKVHVPMPFDREAEIIGFRYHTHHLSGRTSLVADYITVDGKHSFDPVQRLKKVTAPFYENL